MFSLDPETAHHLTLQLAKLSPELGKLSGIAKERKFSFGLGSLQWTFPIGLAAGLDKNAEALPFFEGQGFGALECGTITLRPQDGNPRPRIFRYPEEESLRNAMGFPNQGLKEILPRLKNYQGKTPLGINIGKNKDTTPVESIKELSIVFDSLAPHTDYFVINVSSPNTPGLRALQDIGYLSELFSDLTAKGMNRDLYLKIAPDLVHEKILELKNLALDFKLKGIIATNTTIMPERGPGGVSGRLLLNRANQVRSLLLKEESPLEIIAAGGISDSEDLFNFWKEGGKAAQVYTSYVFKGPALLKHFQQKVGTFLDSHQMDLEQFFKLPLSERQKRLEARVR